MSSSLPIHTILPELFEQLTHYDQAILEAAPGAGKTTVVPLALLAAPWLGQRKIVMLEPRRLAAKAAAKRLAEQLGEPLGQRVGYQIRQEGKQSDATQLLVVTEGILTRMLQEDPSLDDVALIIFDEFHERNLHSDFALALSLQARELFRDDDPLKLLVMSATLDSERLQTLLGCEPLISEGRQFPIDVRYDNLALKQADVPQQVAKQVQRALQEEHGSILVFLPGQREIRAVQQQLVDHLPAQVELLSLYGDLTLKEQEQVIAPAAQGWRKIVLATSIAQTSLTIDGIRVVIDSGLSREARFDAKTATTRLHTRRASQAEAIQRMGRAGRLEPGVCYRWWSHDQQHRLSPQSAPQIELEDLSSLVMDTARWGAADVSELPWVSLPPPAHWQQAQGLLAQLDILTDADTLTLTSLGECLSQYPLPPRLARLLQEASEQHLVEQVLPIAALLYEGAPSSQADTDVHAALTRMERSPQARRWQRTQTSLKQLLPKAQPSPSKSTLATLLAQAFPDRIARRQRQQGDKVLYKLSNGRQVTLSTSDANSQEDFLVVLDLGGHAEQDSDRVYLACPINESEIEEALLTQIEEIEHCEWDKRSGGLVGERQTWLGKLCLKRDKLTALPAHAITLATLNYIRQQGLDCLNWSEDSRQLRARIRFAHQHLDSDLPDASDACLLERLENWLAPFLHNITRLNQLAKVDLVEPLKALLSYPQQQLLERLPTRIHVASGSHIKIDYESGEPILRVKLQEMFGETQSPTIAGQTVKIELLSPAQRPLAVTMDLAFFWREAYPDVRKEMRGRYPKHPWPEDPINAAATSKTNRALRAQD